jgi:hypothetical protein
MYGSIATAALFPELDKSMIRGHERIANRENGSVSQRSAPVRRLADSCRGLPDSFAGR